MSDKITNQSTYRPVFSRNYLALSNGRAHFDVSAGVSSVSSPDAEGPADDAIISIGAPGVHVQASATPAELRAIAAALVACADAIEADAARPTVTLINPLSQEKPLTIDVAAVGGAR